MGAAHREGDHHSFFLGHDLSFRKGVSTKQKELAKITMSKLSEEEEEYLRKAGAAAASGGAVVVVVEYLESTMSKELLGKFPDNSALDFDYTQSSIWSPLIPRRHFAQDLDFELLGQSLFSYSSIEPTVIQRKLIYNEDNQEGFLGNSSNCNTTTILKKLTDSFKRKISTSVSNNLKVYRDTKMMKKKKKANAFIFSPNAASFKGSTNSPTPRKGWAKVLKAASGHFKKTGKKKDYNGAAHMKLSNNYLAYSNVFDYISNIFV